MICCRESTTIRFLRHSGLKALAGFRLNLNLCGNTIDFFVKVLNRTFHQAMAAITEQTERCGA